MQAAELNSREGSITSRGRGMSGGGGGGGAEGGGEGSARGHSRAERLEMMSKLLTPREGGGEGGAAQADAAERLMSVGMPRFRV